MAASAHGDVFRLLVLSDQQLKIQRYPIYYHVKQRKVSKSSQKQEKVNVRDVDMVFF